MSNTSLEDKAIKSVLTLAIGFLVIEDAFGVKDTCTLFGIALGIIGTGILVFEEIREIGAHTTNFSATHNQMSYEMELRKLAWYKKIIIHLIVQFSPYKITNLPVGWNVLDEYATKTLGFGALFLGFLLQLLGVLLS